ncbi:uncharacterized protein LOC106657609 [Trichogramma pretiosum]|uniref:uncharacterized protein LOC106657609 n=1 Tax=Trichogramma pretiosum TaxID=7493 RepID=UPI0006C9C13B|nr:uncharacterized protein LOC106657609 [Trichogramma pretiosum]
MSVNKRRWAGELTESLLEFQSRESSKMAESLDSGKNVSHEENISSMLEKLQIQNQTKSSSEHSACTHSQSNDSNLFDKNNSTNSASNLSFVNDLSVKDLINFSASIHIQDDAVNGSPLLASNGLLMSNVNDEVPENNTFGSDTIKPSSQNSSAHNTIDLRSTMSHPLISNGNVMDLITINLDDGSLKNITDSSLHSVTEINPPKNKSISQNTGAIADDIINRYFSSAMNETKTGQELIAEMDKPEVWDALIALDQALSPTNEYPLTPEEETNYPSNVLTRLSQKFKKTPARFTEKLVSLLEDSILSLESPKSKPNSANSSGISLNRMTGEFRKLCKYIDDGKKMIADESMPEWAPTFNMTVFDKTEIQEEIPLNIEVPKNPAIKRILEEYTTPKSQKNSRNNSPINRFTPSADKSFEYWETVCNLMCESQKSAEKKQKIFKIPESKAQAKKAMEEMLIESEKQLAMLDESIVDVRCSEPCIRLNNEVKLQIMNTPRSKSVSQLPDNFNDKIENPNSSNSDHIMEHHESIKSNSDNLKENEIRKIISYLNDDEQENSNIVERKNSTICLNETIEDKSPLTKLQKDKIESTLSSEKSFKNVSIEKIEKNKINDDLVLDDTVIIPTTEESQMDDDDDEDYELPKKRREINLYGKRILENSFELSRNRDLNLQESFERDFGRIADTPKNVQESIEKDFREIVDSPQNVQETFEKDFRKDVDSPRDISNDYCSSDNDADDSDTDQDCSLLMEIAQRRQRCLDTAKLMMDIDREDPTSSGDDTKCLETLYKFGIQDKTFADVEGDAKFLHTISQCVDYKNYLRDKSKPIISILQTSIESPEIIKNKATSFMRTNQSKLDSTVKNKPPISASKKVTESKPTPRPAAISRVTPRIPPTSANTTNLKSTQKQVSKSISKVETRPGLSLTTGYKTTPRPAASVTRLATPRPASKVNHIPTPRPAPKVTRTATPRPTPKITVPLTPRLGSRVTKTATPKPTPKLSQIATPKPAPKLSRTTTTPMRTPRPAPKLSQTATPRPAMKLSQTATPRPASILPRTATPMRTPRSVAATATPRAKTTTSRSTLNAGNKKAPITPAPKVPIGKVAPRSRQATPSVLKKSSSSLYSASEASIGSKNSSTRSINDLQMDKSTSINKPTSSLLKKSSSSLLYSASEVSIGSKNSSTRSVNDLPMDKSTSINKPMRSVSQTDESTLKSSKSTSYFTPPQTPPLLEKSDSFSSSKPLILFDDNVTLSPAKSSLDESLKVDTEEYLVAATNSSPSDSPELTKKLHSRLLLTPDATSKGPKLLFTPGKSPRPMAIVRKKPNSYFAELTPRKNNLEFDSNNVKSPIGLYMISTDAELVQNVRGVTNDRLLTPVKGSGSDENNELKFRLSSKENKSPMLSTDGNFVLPTVRYQSAKKVHMIADKNHSPLVTSSKTKKLLAPIENTVVIRHEGRVIDYDNSQVDSPDAEMSVRVQKVAEKTSAKKRFL